MVIGSRAAICLLSRNTRHWAAVLGLLVLGTGISLPAAAAGWHTALGIDKIQILSDGTIAVTAISTSSNNECGNKAFQSLSSLSSDARSAMLAVLLAGQARERKMSFYITSCDTGTSRAVFNAVEDAP